MDISVTHGRLGADAADFIAKPRRLLIGSEWVEAKSGKRFAVFDPATSQQITEVAEADAADVDIAVAAARRAFDGGEWARMKPSPAANCSGAWRTSWRRMRTSWPRSRAWTTASP